MWRLSHVKAPSRSQNRKATSRLLRLRQLLRLVANRLAGHLLLDPLGPFETLLAGEARQLALLTRALVDHRNGVVVVLLQAGERMVDKPAFESPSQTSVQARHPR